MNTNLKKRLFSVLCLTVIILPWQNCSPVHTEIEAESASLSSYSETELAAKFSTTLHPILRTNCGGCHGVSQAPQFAVADPLSAVQVIRERALVNFSSPDNSRFVRKIREGHNGFPASLADAVRDGVGTWVVALEGGTVPDVDIEEPAIMITAPSSGAVLASSTTFTVVATDNVGVEDVQYYLDGVELGALQTAPPFSLTVSLVGILNGNHDIVARARDAAGNEKYSAAVVFSINNITPDTIAPTVDVTAPIAGATLSGTVTLSATATDDRSVVGVQFYVDGAVFGAEDLTSPYTISLNTTTLANGAHTISARARDAANNMQTSDTVSVTVNNVVPDTTAPAVSISAPSGGATVSGASVALSANATDAIGVVGVQFLVNGVVQGAEDMSAPYSITWNTTAIANGAYSITARARDAAGNMRTSAAVNVTVNNDTTLPAVSITAPVAGAVLAGNTTLTANASDNVGVVGVQFLVDGAAVGAEDLTSPYSISLNSASLANGAHTISARARDAAGNMRVSANVNVSVNNVGPDTAAPLVSISAPSAGATVSATVSVTATASDNTGVTGVQFLINGANAGSEDLTAPYTYSWNTSGLTNGTHTISARARDAAGNMATAATISVTVNNVIPDTTAPAVSITAPSAGATVSGASVALSANASDAIGVVGVQFLVNGVAQGAEDTSAPYSMTWNTTSLTNGAYSITARARDAAGNMTTSSAVSVTVSNVVPDTTAPAVSISAPLAGATVSGASVTISANATDAVGVVGVQFLVNGVAQGSEDTTSPYSIVWSTTSLANGAYVISARARDAAGNTRTSATVSVTVNNVVANPQATYAFISANILPKCTSCHGATNAESGIRYNTYANTLRTVSPGNPNSSAFYNETKPGGSMPPGGNKLSTSEVTAIRDWIAAGAPNN